MIKAVIFDRDGIIVNSEALHVSSVEKAFIELGIEIDEETKQYIVAKHTDKYKDYLLDKYDFDYETFRNRQREIYYDEIGGIKLFEDIIKLIKNIKKNTEYLLALNTSSSRHGTDIILEKTSLENVFDIITTKEDYVNGKPDPESYLLTAQKLGVDPQDCLVFEDSDVGVKSAKNAGMKCIAIPNEYTKNHDLSMADLIIHDREKINLTLIKDW